MALTKLSTDSIDFSGNTTALTIPSGTTSSNVDFLVVAGGGSGATFHGGGGGAGGYRTSYGTVSPITLSGGSMESPVALSINVAYTVTVGAGAAGVSSGGTNLSGNNGSDSTFSGSFTGSPITSTGGGAGSSYNTQTTPGTGGSGGGGGANNQTGAAAVSSPVVQGFAGGDGGQNSNPFPPGGGGGAGSVGANGTSGGGGNGGDGLENQITGATGVFYAGGGGGGTYLSGSPGTGGSGVGGDGGPPTLNTSGFDGAINTGSGGGGANADSSNATVTGAGGSGVIILRYSSGLTATYSAGAGGAADAEVTIGSDKYIKITAGTGTVTFTGTGTGRPSSPTEGLLRDNTTTGALEFYDGSLWQQIAGTLVADYQPPTATGNFITTLFNGNNTTVTTGFQADLAWVSNRQYANGNFIYDSVRGASNNLWPTGNYAEGVRSGVTAFNATSTTIGTYTSIGSGGSGTNVQWAWKAGGTAVSNPDGTTTSTISKNATTGFSIVKTSSAGGTINVGHGLGSDIGMIILKGVDVAETWQVWHKDVGTGKYLELSSTNAQTTRANSFSTVNSTIFENDWTSGSVIWIAYCWSSITGYSKIGSYAGTGSGNTQSINTGFEVGWVMIKDYTAGGSWFVQDNKRGSQNSITVNTGDAESTTNYVTFTSTGFDVTSGLNDNSVSSSFIYMAFRS